MELTQGEVEDLVATLRSIHNRSSWSRVLDAGKLVLEVLANNEERAWRTISQGRSSSLRRIAEHAGCPFRRTALSSAVNICLFVRANPAVLEAPGITPTHVALLVRFKNEHAAGLLGLASANSWSVRELRRQARILLRRNGERRGRPLSSSARKAETRARRALEALRSVGELLGDSEPSDPNVRAALRRTLDQISELVARTNGQLEHPALVSVQANRAAESVRTQSAIVA